MILGLIVALCSWSYLMFNLGTGWGQYEAYRRFSAAMQAFMNSLEPRERLDWKIRVNAYLTSRVYDSVKQEKK